MTITADDLYSLQFLSNPVLSPDGTDAVVVLTTIEREEEKPPRYQPRIYRVDVTDPGVEKDRLTPLTQGVGDSSPAYSPDGKTLAFLRKPVDGVPQLATISLRGGEANVRTETKAAVSSFVWRDADRILFVSAGDAEEPELKDGLGRIVTRRMHRIDGAGFIPPVQNTLWELTLSTNEITVVREFDFGPGNLTLNSDGNTIAYTAPADADEFDGGGTRVWTYDLDGDTDPVDVLGKRVHISQLRFAENQNLLMFTAEEDLKWGARTSDLWFVEPGKDPERITEEREFGFSAGGDTRFGAFPSEPRWLADSDHVHAIVNERGRTSLVVVDPETGELAELAGGNRVISCFSAHNSRVLFLSESPTTPTELRMLVNGEEYLLSNPNSDLLEKWELPELEERVVTRDDDHDVAYYIHTPKEPRNDNAVIVQIHGGPHTHDGFGFRFEYHVQAAKGYTVLTMNPRGSASFGSAHGAAILHTYGSVDADDIHAMIDDFLEDHTDPKAPVHLTGGSYGGFMTNWLTSHSTRFQSAVTDRSICNWVSFAGTSDIGPFFIDVQIGGMDYNDPKVLWDQSPLRYVDNVVTPTLVVHSEEDFRCPIEQGEQWFTALKRLGKAPTRFVRFPGESHGLSRDGRPDRRVQRIELALEWFAEYA